jgi:peptidoglycan/LPS O-acetylase OafA/YrhL
VIKSKSTQRLLGIDLIRGIAAYAVIFLHSGDESWGLPISQAAISLRLLFYFAVPFFLATSFFFLTSRAEIDTSPRFWRSRIDRILIPYAVWTIIYLIFRSAFFFESQQMDRFWNLLRDPLAIFCFGGASYHLYFLPLLFTGTFLVIIAKYLQQIRINRIFIGCLAILSLVVYEWLTKSGNSFHLNPNTAFKGLSQTNGWEINDFPLLRFVLVQIAWLLNCFPYLLIGITILPLCNQVPKWNSTYRLMTACLCGVIFLGSSAALLIGIPVIVKDVGQAYSLLLLAIILSGYIKQGWIFQSLGVCSFGIYLIHPFAMLSIKGVLAKTLPSLANEVSILSMLTISIGSFMISWIAIALMMKNKWVAKYTLGV